MKYKAVLFDLDGTLLDTALDIIGACNATLTHFGYEPLDEAALRQRVTAGMRMMLKMGVPESKWDTAGIETTMRDYFASYYVEHICDKTVPFDGIASLVESLSENNIKTAVVTNKYSHMANELLKKFPFSKNFQLVLGCDSLTHSKPHPEPILTSCEKLGVKTEDTLYVGDHLNDIKASAAACCDSAVALWGYGGVECGDPKKWGADYLCQDAFELKDLIFGKMQQVV
ncbi:MAG: HAD family hydrolase [Succinivibrio sp.]